MSEKGKIKKRPLIKGKGFSRADWLYSDARATNDYSDKSVLIYLIGKNPNTVLWNFCHSKGDYRDWETDRKSTRLNSSHSAKSRMPSSA